MATTNVNTIRTVGMVHLPVVTDHKEVCAEKLVTESLVISVGTVERMRTCSAVRIISVEVPRKCAQMITKYSHCRDFDPLCGIRHWWSNHLYMSQELPPF